ncbi:ROK family protein [Actinomyces sp. B33]|uniref:ROK family transcriptional regulator n=1 Tax=Actinomyces sp. B33 TaxID=2942131 RepID=UPI00234147F6|nr:ROK family transcriptional regulator [Actinomyces sp. B33]MDC4233839.1 ROK family protein [Actinomyces sp. B33]
MSIDDPALLDIHRRLLDALERRPSSTRPALARDLGVSTSIVSLRIHELIAAGLVVESGSAPSTGGRPSRTLRLASALSPVLAADLGTRHARLALAEDDGTILDLVDLDIDTSSGPEVLLPSLADRFDAMLTDHGRASPGSVCIGLPGPIDPDRGSVDSGARLPGWHGFPVEQFFADRYRAPVAVENDADLLALGEHLAHTGIRSSLSVKAGSALGVGVVIGSRIHRGATGSAGDISHVRITGTGDEPCSCGKTGCLDTVVSGRALGRQWNRLTGGAAGTDDLIASAIDGDALAVRLLRTAGTRLGEALCLVAGFFNPDAVFIGGRLSTVEVFLASVRAALYTGCHPLITRRLIIEAASTGENGGVLGAIARAREIKPRA